MKKKMLSGFLAVLLLIAAAAVPAAVFSAAAPSVQVIDGQRTVFLSSFGRITYASEVYPAYRSFEEAIAALGNEGGKIVFSGNFDLSGYSDPEGRGPLTFEGIGKVSGSVLDFGEAPSVELRGDTYVNNMTIKTVPDAVIHTNGYVFETLGSFECNYKEQFVEGGNNTITYIAPFIFSAGTLAGDKKAKTVELSSGHYKAVAGGSVGSDSINGDTVYEICGGVFDSVYAGNYNSQSSFSGNSEINIRGGKISRAVAGSDSGTTNANLSVNIYGGEVGKLYIGSDSGAMIEGNVCITLVGGVSSIISEKSTIRGKTIIIGEKSEKIPAGSYDYLINAKGTTVKPVYSGTTLVGFNISDSNGFIPSKVYVNGSEIQHSNGVFTIPEGESTVTCDSAAAISVNKSASYVSGYEDGTFLPQNNITRAEAITMLSKIICADIKGLSSVAACSYSDVAPDAWYAGVMGFFEKLGYLEKLESANGSEIYPNQYITRAEFSELARHVITVIYNGKEFGVIGFSDVKPDNKYFDSIGQLAYLGVINGYDDGTFRPENNITRAEAVTLVNRMLGRVPTGENGEIMFADSADHWAKSQIAAACNPAQSGGVVVWTMAADITKGNFELLSGDGVTVGDQIRNLREKYDSISVKDAVEGIDAVSKWQINNIINSKSEYETKGRIFYVSNNGDDSNDGLSPETAWKNLNRVSGINAMKDIKVGDVVLFERGGEWRGKLNCLAGITYSAYGEGAKPIINSSKRNYADEKLWGETEYPNVYKLKLTVPNAGIMAFDFSGVLGNYKETVGTMKLLGAGGFTGYADLKNDLEFYSDLSSSELYLYCEGGNPGTRFKNIEIGGEGGCVSIPAPGNVIIDNMTFRFTGTHGIGIGGLKDVTVRNCTFDYLGGSVLRGFHGVNTTRYGNALQVYGSCDGWYLYNNWMYQIYDTGVTHQYNSPYDKGSATMDNVRYVGNVIEYCHWSIEYYNPDYGNGRHTFNNTYIADNICRLNGYGWGSVPRMKGSTLFQSAGVTENTENFMTENNIFDRSAGKLININSPGDRELVLRDNIYVQKQGEAMGTLFGAAWTANDSAAKTIANSCGDTTSIIIYNNDTTVNNYFDD